MSSATPSITVLRRAFVDICAGYSIGYFQGKPLYVRHLSHRSHILYEDKQARFEEEALAKGAIREATALEALKRDGLWSDAKETEIERQRDAITRFEEGRRTVVIPSMIEHYDKQIAEERAKLAKLVTERGELLRLTVELYAQQRLNDHYIVTNVFADEALSRPLFPADVFEDLPDSDIQALLDAYHQAIEPCSDANLRRLAVQDFFTSYYTLSADNVSAFYGKPICELTYYQIRLGGIARYFRSIMEQTDMAKLDPQMRHDPDAIEKSFTAQKNMAKMEAEGKLPAGGMNEQDMKSLGLEGKMANVTENLSGAELVARLMKGKKG